MNKIAVVTGFAGFIGTTFTQLLLRSGWRVYGIDKFTHVANQAHLNYDTDKFTWIKEDIRKVIGNTTVMAAMAISPSA